jgi:predicted amidohydrolase
MSGPADLFRVALIQTRTPATHAAALAHVEPMIRQAAGEGARFIVTPEGTNLLQKDRAKLLPMLKGVEDDPVVQGLCALATELKIELLIGSALVKREADRDDGQAANRAVLVGADGRITATYDKIHMFDVDLPNGETARESRTYTPGDRAVVVDAGFGRLGLTICYDMRFPHLYRALAKAGAAVIAAPAAFTRPTGEAHWAVLLRARAIETGAFVLAAAQGGSHEDGRGTWGRSMAISPWGTVIGQLDHDEPGVLIADLDLSEVQKARDAIPALRNDRAFCAPEGLAVPVGVAAE